MDLNLNEILEKNNTIENKELNNNLTEGIEINNNSLDEALDIALNDRQNYFLNSHLGQAISRGLDVGINILLPEYIGNQVIDLKNTILESDAAFGLRDIVANAIIDGKKSIGLDNKNYESITQAKKVVEEGKVLEKVYDFIDFGISELKNDKKVDNKTSKKLTDEKEVINNSIEKNVEESFDKQFKNFEKLEKYIENWKDNFKNKDFSGMQKEYYKMNTVMKEIMPLEKTINEYRYIENMQKLIKNNNKSFDLTEEQIELANKLFN